MFREARCFYSGRSLRIASVVVAFIAAQVVAASEEFVQIQDVNMSLWAGGTDVHIRTNSNPIFSAYELEAPARFVIDLEQATVESEKLQSLQLKSEFFDSISITSFSEKNSPSVRVEFSLSNESLHGILQADNELIVSFSRNTQSINQVFSACNESVGFDDLSGFSMSVSPSEDISSITDVASSKDYGSADSLLLTLPSGYPVVEPNVARSFDSGIVEIAQIVDAESAFEQSTLSELQLPVIAEHSQSTERRVDFRELEEAPTLEQMPILAQVQSPSLSNNSLKSTQQQSDVEYTGAPINLDLKNIEIVEILRIFADLSSMNIIIDPGIKGQVTVKMRDVPWDQAFLVILRNQGLGFTIDGNIVRVASLKKLDAEVRAQAKLRESQMIAEPLSTEIIYLNYATPNQIQKLLKTQMSNRGQVLTDLRTNSLIVRDLQQNITKVKRLVEILDVRTKQIAINAQIVSASKSFTRDLGIAWNGKLVASPEFGNDTGLSFPNDISTNFGVQLPAGGNGFVGFQFGNLLDNINLDVILAASESEGITKTISNPRVVTSDNVSASVRSGQIIPYQSSSISGNTVVATVIFREAAVSLSVTPHVASDNYIRMKVTIASDSPNFDVATAAGPPIRTNSLNTTVLVKDGDTFVVGGLNSSSEGTNSNKVPFLHRLPVLGNLFKNKRTVNAYTDLLMFVTPVILQDETVQRKSLVFESYDVKNKDAESPKTP